MQEKVLIFINPKCKVHRWGVVRREVVFPTTKVHLSASI